MEKVEGSNIADETSRCFELFKLIRRRLHSTGPVSDGADPHLGVSDETIEDALSRFNVWSGNIGAMRRGKSSLDHRLTHADVRMEVLRLLRQLRSSLSELWDIVSGVRQQQTWHSIDAQLSFESFSDEVFSDDGDCNNNHTPSEGDGDEEVPSDLAAEQETESGQLHVFINEAITSLFKLSMFIRKSARGNKFAKSSAEKKYETQPDILHVRDRFPFASHNPGLIERLGKANAQRRQWVSYRKRHREKLGTTSLSEDGKVGLQDFHSTVESAIYYTEKHDEAAQSTFTSIRGLTSATTDLSSTEASTFYEQLPTRPDIEDNSEAGYSETSYNTSRQSDSGEGINYVPQPPPESEDQNPFECPYCFTILTISSINAWTKHVHSDLASYICTQENCSHPLFESRHQWFNHELEVHRHEWICSFCSKASQSVKHFEQHLKQQHIGVFDEKQLATLITQAQRPLQRILASSCPLCDYDSVLRRRMNIGDAIPSTTELITVKPQAFRAHLGRHLEQIALFVLPRSELMELHDAPIQSTAAFYGDIGPLDKTALSDDSAAEQEDPNLTPVSEGQKTLDDESSMQLHAGQQNTLIEILPESDEILEELTTAPELAIGWLPPMNFTPPEKDFEADDIDWIPRREDSMFGGDLFTPGWVRGYEKEKEGFCGRCEPGVWHKIDDLSYENDLTYRHGIDSSGIPLPRPSSIRPVEGKFRMWEGYCEACRGWRILRTTKMGWNWFRHCVTEHNSASIETRAPFAQELSQAHTTQTRVDDLVASIRMGDFSNLASIIKQSGQLLELDSLMRTPLHYSAEVGSIEAVQLLINEYVRVRGSGEVKAFMNAKSLSGETALMLAASQGNEEVAELLITNGADINASSSNGQTALDCAAEGGYRRIIENLIKHNADVQKSNLYSKIRLRNKRIAQQEAEAASSQLKPLTAEKVLGSVSDWTPLMVAATNGDVDIIQRLLEVGVDIEASSNNGETALMLGASRGHHDVVRILLSSGANIDATNGKGWTTLMLAVRDEDEKTVDLLLSNGADVNHLSPDRWTALAEATFQSQTSIIALLLHCGADTESKSSHDWTPLMHAAYKGDEEAVTLLLGAGAKMDISSLHDETAILLAVAGSHSGIVQTLLDAGCAPEPAWAMSKISLKGQVQADEIKGGAHDRASLGWTPLMLACQNGLEDVVRMLLRVGVNLEPQSPYRKTALMIAKENGRLEIAKLLEDYSATGAMNPA